MANVKIVGDAVVFTSDLKLEELKMVKKSRPKALCLYEEGEDGKPAPVFCVDIRGGEVRPSDMNENGITFRKASRDGGYAQITCKVPDGDGDVKDLVAEAFGVPLMNLTKLEEDLPYVIDELNVLKESVLDSIEVL